MALVVLVLQPRDRTSSPHADDLSSQEARPRRPYAAGQPRTTAKPRGPQGLRPWGRRGLPVVLHPCDERASSPNAAGSSSQETRPRRPHAAGQPRTTAKPRRPQGLRPWGRLAGQPRTMARPRRPVVIHPCDAAGSSSQEARPRGPQGLRPWGRRGRHRQRARISLVRGKGDANHALFYLRLSEKKSTRHCFVRMIFAFNRKNNI